jgi:hypothetical protein
MQFNDVSHIFLRVDYSIENSSCAFAVQSTYVIYIYTFMKRAPKKMHMSYVLRLHTNILCCKYMKRVPKKMHMYIEYYHFHWSTTMFAYDIDIIDHRVTIQKTHDI